MNMLDSLKVEELKFDFASKNIVSDIEEEENGLLTFDRKVVKIV